MLERFYRRLRTNTGAVPAFYALSVMVTTDKGRYHMAQVVHSGTEGEAFVTALQLHMVKSGHTIHNVTVHAVNQDNVVILAETK